MSIIFLLIAFVTAIQANANNTDSTKPVNLQDEGYGPWKTCDETENCLQKRIHLCANSTQPHISCGRKTWKQEYVGCYTCPNDVWQQQGAVSKCDGTGCDDTVQRFKDTCANRAVNPNCQRIRTRFCSPNVICDGTWSTWSSDAPKCENQCGPKRLRDMHRTCKKAGKKSSSCATKDGEAAITMEETYFDHCTDKPCQTTVASTTIPQLHTTIQPKTTTEPKTTAQLKVTAEQKTASVTSWSAWSICDATCQRQTGMEFRYRKCVYENAKPAPNFKCTGNEMREEKKCSFANVAKCKKGRNSENGVVPTVQTTSDSLAATDNVYTHESSGDQSGKFPRIKQPNAFITKPQNEVNTTSENVPAKKQGMGENEMKVLIIVLVTTVILILVVVVIYIFCGRRNRERNSRRKGREIAVVGLQSHTGFMEGMESYGFTKSTLPTGPLLSARNPSTNDALPDGEESATKLSPSLQTNQNSHHIYEDVRHFDNNEMAHASMQRSLSDRKKRQINDASNAETQARRKSCFETRNDVTPRRSAPPKPPRMSMMVFDSDSIATREMREVPKYLYKKESKIQTPDLRFIDSIHPPANTPPTTPLDQRRFQKDSTANLLNLPHAASNKGQIPSHSAPASPVGFSIGGPLMPLSPHVAYVPNSLFIPYGGGQLAPPVQNQNSGVLYVPISPVYSPAMQMGTISPVILRNRSFHTAAKRPQTISFLPRISISNTEKNHHSPHRAVKNPLDGYAEMQQLSSPKLPLDCNELQTKKSESINKRSSDEVNNNSTTEISEDVEGYLLPSKT